VNDNWLTDALHRVDERCARHGDGREAAAGQFSGLCWLAFWAVAVGVPVGLWRYNADLTGLVGSAWQGLAALLSG